jgi:hypothetical protein
MKRNATQLVCLVSGLFGAACGNSTPATEADYDDVAQALSAAVATTDGGGEVGSFYDSASIITGSPSLDVQLKAGGEFAGRRVGMMYDYKVECSDRSGAELSNCGSNTDDASIDVNWSGELALPTLQANVTRKGSWQLSNVQSGTVDIAGDSDFDLDTHFESIFRLATRDYHLSYSADYSDVKVRLKPMAVVGGAVHYVIDAERKASGVRHESDAQFHMKGVLTFQPDGSAELTLDGDYHYSIDTNSGVMIKTDGALRPADH